MSTFHLAGNCQSPKVQAACLTLHVCPEAERELFLACVGDVLLV